MDDLARTRIASKKTLILTRRDVEGLLSISEYNKGVEQCFRVHGLGTYIMEPKGHIYVEDKYKGGEWEIMPAYSSEDPESGVCKYVAIREDNPSKGLPMVYSTIIYHEPETGFPLAIIDGTYHTYMRTGASAGVGAKWLARKDSSVLALMGAGGVGKASLLSVDDFFPISEVRVWTRSAERQEEFLRWYPAQQLKNEIKVTFCNTIEEAVREADIIATSTPSRQPLIMNDWVKDGAHISAVGGGRRNDQELEPHILKRGRVFVDDIRQCVTEGEINVPLKKGEITEDDVDGSLGEVVTGKKKGRRSDTDVTIFDSTGIALQEATTAPLEFARALELGRGIEVNMVL